MTSGEFNVWRKSSHSSGNSECVEVAAGPGWRKSSYSGGNADCVEIAAIRRAVGVRDTKQHGTGPVLEFPAVAWQAFANSLK